MGYSFYKHFSKCDFSFQKKIRTSFKQKKVMKLFPVHKLPIGFRYRCCQLLKTYWAGSSSET